MTKTVKTLVEPAEIINKIQNGWVFTIVDSEAKEHYCFRTKRLDPISKMLEVKGVGGKWEQIGFLMGDTEIHMGPLDDMRTRRARVIFVMFFSGMIRRMIPSNLILWVPFRCVKCKRLLTDPYSIKDAAGPTCKKHVA